MQSRFRKSSSTPQKCFCIEDLLTITEKVDCGQLWIIPTKIVTTCSNLRGTSWVNLNMYFQDAWPSHTFHTWPWTLRVFRFSRSPLNGTLEYAILIKPGKPIPSFLHNFLVFRTMCTVKRATYIICSIWIFSMLYHSYWLFLATLIQDDIGTSCSFRLERNSNAYKVTEPPHIPPTTIRLQIVFLLDFVLWYVLPILCDIIIYAKIGITLSQCGDKIKKSVKPKSNTFSLVIHTKMRFRNFSLERHDHRKVEDVVDLDGPLLGSRVSYFGKTELDERKESGRPLAPNCFLRTTSPVSGSQNARNRRRGVRDLLAAIPWNGRLQLVCLWSKVFLESWLVYQPVQDACLHQLCNQSDPVQSDVCQVPSGIQVAVLQEETFWRIQK